MNEFLWVEKYRPATIAECVLPDRIKNGFEEIVKQGEIPNMLLCGTAGTGKTTVAKALCNELGVDHILINGSDESGIDVLRTKIKDFASTVSFGGQTKVVILDEADYLNPNSTQPALRAFIEEFSANCRFIFTCNFKNRIIEPLHSRCAVIDFKLNKDEKQLIAGKFMKRLTDILTENNIDYSEKVVAELLMKYFPDYRRTLNELQRYSKSGVIDEGILSNIAEVNIKGLIDSLKDKDFKKMRRWVVDNIDLEPASIFRGIYDTMDGKVEKGSIPQLILILADYQYKNAFVADHELNLVACLTEVMANVSFE